MKISRQFHQLSAKRKVAYSTLVIATAFFLMLLYALSPPSLTLGHSVKYSYSIEGIECDVELDIKSDSDSYRKLQAWFKKTRAWWPDVNSYASMDVISSDKMIVNIMDNRVVVNLLDGSSLKWTQYSCGVDKELRTLTDSLHESLKQCLDGNIPIR